MIEDTEKRKEKGLQRQNTTNMKRKTKLWLAAHTALSLVAVLSWFPQVVAHMLHLLYKDLCRRLSQTCISNTSCFLCLPRKLINWALIHCGLDLNNKLHGYYMVSYLRVHIGMGIHQFFKKHMWDTINIEYWVQISRMIRVYIRDLK